MQRKASLPVTKIQSVKTIRKGARDIPKAFEIFTNEQTYVFKAKDTEHAQKWVECLQIAVARTQSSRDQVTDFDLQTWDVSRVHKLRASARSSQLTQERHADRADARKHSDATPAATTAESASPATHPPTTDRMPDTKPEASQSKNELSKSSAVRQSVRRRSDSKPTMPSSTDDACKKTNERDEKTVKDTNSSELDGGSTRASRRRKKSQTKL